MKFINIEVKFKYDNLEEIRKKLKLFGATYEGLDHQIDTYFETKNGKLKLREGNIENNLIFYERQNKKGPKLSTISTYKVTDSKTLKELLNRALNNKIVINKKREIYWIHNVKFHLDQVKGLGKFIEIEAIDYNRTIGKKKLLEQCNYYLMEFNINKDQLITNSYSDLLEISS
ncbi:MAG: class IV adenylate cyclase [Patescibacteria group bacterium]|jgi:predicted adenylyl cyclase CyaB